MGCVGARQKNKDENNLFIKLLSSSVVNIKRVDENNLEQVVYIRFIINGEEMITEDIQNLKKINLEAILNIFGNTSHK